jgi:uncharacterized membrane protein
VLTTTMQAIAEMLATAAAVAVAAAAAAAVGRLNGSAVAARVCQADARFSIMGVGLTAIDEPDRDFAPYSHLQKKSGVYYMSADPARLPHPSRMGGS